MILYVNVDECEWCGRFRGQSAEEHHQIGRREWTTSTIVFSKKDISIGDDEGPLGKSTIGIPLRGDSKRLEKLKQLEELEELEEEVPPITDTAYGTHHTCSVFQSESLRRDTTMANNGGTVDCAEPMKLLLPNTHSNIFVRTETRTHV